MGNRFIVNSFIKNFESYRVAGINAFKPMGEDDIHWLPGGIVNSVSVLGKHVAGHLKSRYTDFFEKDGENETRNRDAEFMNANVSCKELELLWEEAFDVVKYNLELMTDDQLTSNKMLRGKPMVVVEYLATTLAHCAYHTGQIVVLSKLFAGANQK